MSDNNILNSAPGSSAVPSPCIGICRMVAATGLCEGCHRTIEEIAAWSRLDDGAKWDICEKIAERVPASLSGISRTKGSDLTS
jgi:predicted Fe-S protein YdhL (DUF1289 family)